MREWNEMEGYGDITGGKVILRTAKMQDREMLLNLIRDPEIMKVTKGYQNPVTGRYLVGRFGSPEAPAGSVRRIIADQGDPESGLGIIMLSDLNKENRTAKMQIKLLRSARGRGYGRDAVDALVSYAFRELGLDCICSSILEDNTASRRLFEACGFQQEGIHESRADRNGHCRKICSYVKRDAEPSVSKKTGSSRTETG